MQGVVERRRRHEKDGGRMEEGERGKGKGREGERERERERTREMERMQLYKQPYLPHVSGCGRRSAGARLADAMEVRMWRKRTLVKENTVKFSTGQRADGQSAHCCRAT